MALATVVWSLVCAVTFVFARETRSADYRPFSKHLLGPWGLSGSNFDRIPDAPRGLEGVDRRPAILVELAHRGWSDEDLAKVAGGDILRVLRDAEQVATKLQGTEAPSAGTITDLGGTKPTTACPDLSNDACPR